MQKNKPLARKKELKRSSTGNYYLSCHVENRQSKLMIGLQAALVVGLYMYLMWAYITIPDMVCK